MFIVEEKGSDNQNDGQVRISRSVKYAGAERYWFNHAILYPGYSHYLKQYLHSLSTILLLQSKLLHINGWVCPYDNIGSHCCFSSNYDSRLHIPYQML